jgi:histidine ammonia-lyase
MLTALRALDFRKPLKSSPVLEQIRDRFRLVVPASDDDQPLQPLIESTKNFLETLD